MTTYEKKCIDGYNKEMMRVAYIMAYGTQEQKDAKLSEYGL